MIYNLPWGAKVFAGAINSLKICQPILMPSLRMLVSAFTQNHRGGRLE
jgi:hypothetical protein